MRRALPTMRWFTTSAARWRSNREAQDLVAGPIYRLRRQGSRPACPPPDRVTRSGAARWRFNQGAKLRCTVRQSRFAWNPHGRLGSRAGAARLASPELRVGRGRSLAWLRCDTSRADALLRVASLRRRGQPRALRGYGFPGADDSCEATKARLRSDASRSSLSGLRVGGRFSLHSRASARVQPNLS